MARFGFKPRGGQVDRMQGQLAREGATFQPASQQKRSNTSRIVVAFVLALIFTVIGLVASGGKQPTVMAWRVTSTIAAGQTVPAGAVAKIPVPKSMSDGFYLGKSPVGLLATTTLPADTLLVPADLGTKGYVIKPGQVGVWVPYQASVDGNLVPGMLVYPYFIPNNATTTNPNALPPQAVQLTSYTVRIVEEATSSGQFENASNSSPTGSIQSAPVAMEIAVNINAAPQIVSAAQNGHVALVPVGGTR